MESNQKIDSLNSLKGIYIFMIVLFHVHSIFGDVFYRSLSFFYQYGGQIGDYFFFIVSGFTIAYSYKDKILSLTLFSFIKKRIMKLYPIFLASTIIQILFAIKYFGYGVINFKNIILNLLLITSGWADDIIPYNNPCWFLSQLLLCYIIYFVITKFCKQTTVPYIWLILIFWGYILENKNWKFPFCYAHDGEGFMNFFIGCMLFELYTKCSIKQKKKICYLGGIIILLILLWTRLVGFQTVAGDTRLVFSLLICPVTLLMAIEIIPVRKLLETKWLQFIFGRNISTYIFFWHIPLVNFMQLISHFFNNNYIALLLYLLLLFTFTRIASLYPVTKMIKEKWGSS